MRDIFAVLLFGIAFAFGCGIALDVSGPDAVPSLLPSAVVLTLFATYSVLTHGHNVVNASSATSYALLLFGGFPAIFAGLGLNPMVTSELVPSLVIAEAFVALMLATMLLTRVRQDIAIPPRDMSGPAGSGGRVWLGLFLFVLAISATLVGLVWLAAPLGILGTFFVADAAFSRTTPGAFISLSLIAALLAVCYVLFVFEGFGRLVLGMLFCGLASLASLHIRRRWVKMLMVAGTAFALPLLAADRVDYLTQTRGASAAAFEGIGSVVGPLVSFARIIQASINDVIEPTWGSSLFATSVFWVPRSVWESKPDGFGVEIIPITQPQLYGAVGYSDAATIGGEFVWNFGLVWGMILVLVFAWALRYLDSLYLSPNIGGQDWVSISGRILLVVVASSLLHLVWGGSHTFVTRTIVMVGLLALMRAHFVTVRRHVEHVRAPARPVRRLETK